MPALRTLSSHRRSLAGRLRAIPGRRERVYVAHDRDSIDKSTVLAREFGMRGRVVVPPRDSHLLLLENKTGLPLSTRV